MKTFTIILCMILLVAPQIYGNCNDSEIDANALCQQEGSLGAIALECDESCNSFVLCYNLGGELQGMIKTCPSDKYFDKSSKYCSTNKPQNCA